jgi:hypothetical protein
VEEEAVADESVTAVAEADGVGEAAKKCEEDITPVDVGS